MTTVDFDLESLIRAFDEAMYESGWCQRTTERRHSWRHISEGGFDKSRYKVARLEWKTARDFIATHHYSGTYGSMKGRYGLVEVATERLVGVCTLGSPMSDKVLTNPLPTLDQSTASEINRLVLLDEVPANAESHFVRKVLRDATGQGLRGAVMFSDPVPRPDVGMDGHVGTTYQAAGADYCDRATARPLIVLPDNTVLTDRATQKIRGEEQGWQGVVRRLVACGARPYGELAGAAYVRAALKDVNARKSPHPGNHRFVIRLGTKMQRRMTPLGVGYEPRPYPKTPDPIPTYEQLGALN